MKGLFFSLLLHHASDALCRLRWTLLLHHAASNEMWLAKQRHSLNCQIHLVAFDTFFPTIPGQNSKMVLDRIYMDLGLLHFLVLLARAYLDTASCSKKILQLEIQSSMYTFFPTYRTILPWCLFLSSIDFFLFFCTGLLKWVSDKCIPFF